MNSSQHNKLSSVSRLTTLIALFQHFSHRRRLILLPLLFVLLLCGVILMVTGGLSYVAPFFYAAF